MNSQKVTEIEKKTQIFLMEIFCLECNLLFLKSYMIVFVYK